MVCYFRKATRGPGNIGRVPELDVWLALNTALFNDGFKRYGHLEKKEL